MRSCVSIRLKNKPNFEYCQSYRVTANDDGLGAGIRAILCGGNTTSDRWISAGESQVICCEFGTPPTKISGTSTITVELIGVCTDENSSPADEAIYFDLPDGFSLRETKRMTELTDVQTLKFTYSIGFDLPPTKHNLDLIKKQFNPNVLDNDYAEFEVEVVAGSHIISESQLYIQREGAERITAELRLSVNHWGKLSKNLKLRDLPYADVTWGCDLITDVITNQYIYELSNDFDDSDNLGIWFPWVDYGRLVRDTSISGRNNNWVLPVCYNRPWYYVTGLLQRGFCKLGWGFTSPIFESEKGRRMLAYIMDRSYGLNGQVYEQRRNNLNVKAESQGDTSLNFQYGGRICSVWWPQITSDPVGNMDPIYGWYSACGEVNMRGKVILQNVGDSTKFTLHIARTKGQEPYPVGSGGSFNFDSLASREFSNIEDEIEWEFELENISMSSEEQINIIIQRDGGGLVLLKDTSFIEYEGVRPYPSEGDAESLQNMIDNQYSFLDLLKGLAGQFNLKFITDIGNRTVGIYQPYTRDFWGETVEGFFIEDDIETISRMLDPTSKLNTSPDTDQPRYIRVKYAESNDTYIESLELKDELWSTQFDLGEKFTVREENEITNSFFEPTANRNSRFANAFGLHIPKIGGETEYTFDVGPRIVMAHGFVIQELDNVNNPQLRLCTCEADLSPLIPTSSMYSPVKIGVTHNDELSDVAFPKENLVYGVNPEISTLEPEVTLFDLVYLRYLIEQLNNITIEYLAQLTTYDYWRFDFRRFFRFMHQGRPINARMQLIKDFRYCEKIPTPIVFIPERQLSDICDLLPPTIDEAPICVNNPAILCSIPEPGHYVFTIGGQNNSPIDSVLFEYSTDGGMSWMTITPLTPISAELNPISVAFQVRATVTYAEEEGETCPAIELPPKPIDPCPAFDYVQDCEQTKIYSPDNPNTEVNAVRLLTSLPPGQTVTVISAEYSLDGAPNEVIGTTISNDTLITDPVSGGFAVEFYISIQIGICPQIDLIYVCVIDQGTQGFTPPSCEDIVLNLTCVEEFTGCWTFARSGIIFGEYDDYIKYRCSEDGITYGPWQMWDESTPVCCNYVQARWWVVFCGDICPTQCSEIITCEVVCLPFETGSVDNIALCNQGN